MTYDLRNIDRFCAWCGIEHGSTPEESAACVDPWMVARRATRAAADHPHAEGTA